ncbi:DUF2975 domain-containing protein [Clavibacter michiganensis]|uniref:DUF2975 domain-containing protein n=1 Tax=Clavibacter michiganensis TaxID=28447 RepID=A0A251YR75_9MICO|nr:DUF2975 domain-containing protein [Clavibacter michiganensis]OUE26732.1 hypothetical protein BFL37_04925 [Clavibacter michiganensis]
MARITRLGAKTLLAVLIALAAVVQALMVAAAAGPLGDSEADLDGLVVPVAAWIVAVALCAQVVCVLVWRLTTLAGGDGIYEARAFRFVRGIIAATAVATALGVAAFCALALAAITPPAVMIALLGAVALGGAACLVLVIMLALLRRAAEDHAAVMRLA